MGEWIQSHLILHFTIQLVEIIRNRDPHDLRTSYSFHRNYIVHVIVVLIGLEEVFKLVI